MKTLIIAEKKEVQDAIAEALGGGQRGEGFVQCGDTKITSASGHLFEALEPHDYDPKYKKWVDADLPFSFIPWKSRPMESKKDKVALITRLIKDADTIVHAGDPDDEGQKIVDDLLHYAGNSAPVKRLLVNDNNPAVIRRLMDNMPDNERYVSEGYRADARAIGDLLYGFNMSRAYTLKARSIGSERTLSVGRVSTPILGLVVRRTQAFKAHAASFYYLVTGQFDVQGVTFSAKYMPATDAPTDEKKRIIDKGYAEDIIALCDGSSVVVRSVTTTNKNTPPPLPFNTVSLDSLAAKKFGYKPKRVLEITQSLRTNHKLITYNRSDSRYLNEEHHADGPEKLAAIAATCPDLAGAVGKTDSDYKSRAFDNAKVNSAHHGIIPTATQVDPSKLTKDERNIYYLIARQYVAQFAGLYTYTQTVVTVRAGEHNFKATANVTTAAGWRSILSDEKETDESDLTTAPLSTLSEGDSGECSEASSTEKKTKPAPLYTMSSLMTDLTQVAKYVKDPELRKVLIEKDKNNDDKGGIGTGATRGEIIDKLFSRGLFLEDKRGNITSSQEADEFYSILPDAAKYPDLTAIWHEELQDVGNNTITKEDFVRSLVAKLDTEIRRVRREGFGDSLKITVTTEPCPKCSASLKRLKAKNKNSYFWVHLDDAAQTACQKFITDHAGKPVLEAPAVPCPKCGEDVRQIKKVDKVFWVHCQPAASDSCQKFISDKDDKPVLSERPATDGGPKTACPDCSKPLVRREQKKKKGAFFWVHANSQHANDCTQFINDEDGKPTSNK